MENLIFSRVVLLFFTIVNLFIAYGASAVWNPINKKFVNGFYGFEVTVLTLFIVYDNMTTPLNDTLTVAILGYAFVYLVLILGYFSYLQWTIVTPNKEYAAKIVNEYIVISGCYFISCNIKGNYGGNSNAYIPIEQVFKEPENKEKDITGLYKVWSVDGKLNRSYMKYQVDEEVKVKYKKYFTRHKYLVVDLV